MKSRDLYSINGVIFNQIIDIIARNAYSNVPSTLVICADDEIFEEAQKSIFNHYPQATGQVPHTIGVKQAAPYADMTIVFDRPNPNAATTMLPHQQTRIVLCTQEYYDANKATIDALALSQTRNILWTGGEA